MQALNLNNMKQKLVISVFLALLLTVGAFAQSKNQHVPLIAEDEIKSITVKGNIHVLLLEDKPDNIGVQAKSEMVGKLKIEISGDHLYISPSRKANAGDQLFVYVRVSDLRRLELRDNSIVTSFGVLNSKNLNIVLNERSKLAVRSNGEVHVSTPKDFTLSKENGYYSVYAMGVL